MIFEVEIRQSVEGGARGPGEHDGFFDADLIHRANPFRHVLRRACEHVGVDVDRGKAGLVDDGLRRHDRGLGRVILQRDGVHRARPGIHAGTAPRAVARFQPFGIQLP